MTSKPNLTSVIMVSYNTGPVLFDAILHVLATTGPVELCLVDNGNPPDVLKKLQGLAAAEPRLKLMTGHGNVGFSAGCNRGAKAAEGGWLLFLNPDSLLPVGAIDRLIAHAALLPRPMMLGARLLDDNGADQRGCRRALLTPRSAIIEAMHLHRLFPKERLNFNDQPVPSKITPMPAISGAFMFLSRDDFWRINGFDEGYFLHVEDLDFCLRFRRAGGEIYFVPDVVVTHIGGTSKTTTSFLEKNKARGFIRYFQQNFAATYSPALIKTLELLIWLRCYIKLVMGMR